MLGMVVIGGFISTVVLAMSCVWTDDEKLQDRLEGSAWVVGVATVVLGAAWLIQSGVESVTR